jgi:uncharacterized membrane protein YfcA
MTGYQDVGREHQRTRTCEWGLSLMLICIIASTLAWAQERTGRGRPAKAGAPVCLAAVSFQGGQPSARVTFNIPSQPLPQMLTDFSLATGVQILHGSEQASNLTPRPVVGAYALAQALQL